MNNIFITLLSLFVIFSACKKDDKNTPNAENPTVHFHHPSSSDMPAPGDTVSIEAHATDNNHIQRIRVTITPENTNMFPDFVSYDLYPFNPTTDYHLDTFFVANLHSGTMSNYTIDIEAYDEQNNMGSASVTFHVMDSGNGTCSTCGGTDCGCDPNTCQCSMGNCSCSGG